MTPTTDRRRRVVVFIVTSFWAYGELNIAVEFAARMADTDFEPLFVIPPTHRTLIAATGLRYQVLIPGSGKINRIQLQDIALVHRPAAVVLADFLNYDFCDRHYGLTRADLNVFDCPVGTFDNFSWGRPGSFLDTYGFRARYQDDIATDGLAFRLRPCPLNSPVVHEDSAYPYPLLDTSAEVIGTGEADEARSVRAELGIPNGRPLVLLTGATWQRMHVAYPVVTAFVKACTAMVERLLLGLLGHAAVVSVGHSLIFAGGAPPGFQSTDSLPPEQFRRLATAADLHISNNLISVTLHRLAIAGVPSVTLFSSLVKDGDQMRSLSGRPVQLGAYAADVIEGVHHLYPFRMFPVGWFHFLHSLVDGNPFTDVVRHVELFDEAGAQETIGSLLCPGPKRDELAQARHSYLDVLAQLPGVGSILDRITEEVTA